MVNEIISLRVDPALRAYCMEKVKTFDMSQTEIIKNLIDVGMNNQKELNDKLREVARIYKQIRIFEMCDQEIKMAMKMAYNFSNLKKLALKMENDELSITNIKGVIIPVMRRLKKVTPNEEGEAVKWLKQKGYY